MRYPIENKPWRHHAFPLITLWNWGFTLAVYGIVALFLFNFTRISIYVRLAPSSSLFTNFVPLLTAVILILLAVSGAHEIGHVLGGKLAGLRFQLLIIGPFKLTRVQGNLHWSWSRGGLFNGLAASIPEQNHNLRQRMLLFAMGGPAASLLLALGAGVFAWTLRDNAAFRHDMAWLWESALLVTAVSAIFFLSTMKPGRYQNGLPADGGRILMLMRGNPAAVRWCALVALNSANMRGVRPSAWDADLIQQAQSYTDGSYDDLTAQLLIYQWSLDSGFVDEAVHILETAVDSKAAWISGARAHLALEMAYHLAYYRHQAEDASFWLQQAQRGPSVQRYRAEAAVYLAAEQYEQAALQAQAGLDALQRENRTGIDLAEQEWLQKLLDESQRRA
ncbi:MAG: hypothetical protein R3E31_24905 [Chloroflexota bacterium]